MKRCSPDELTGLVYAINGIGHRRSYLDRIGAELRLQPVCGQPSISELKRLIGTQRLFLVTFDDDLRKNVFISCVRGLLGLPTVALFLRPQQCYVGSLKSRLKYWLFRCLRKIPGLTLLTIVPFDFEPHYAHVAHDGVHDPQWWDMHDGVQLRSPPETKLSHDLRAQAGGRRILSMIGFLDMDKGFGFLADILSHAPKLAEQILIVAAGPLQDESRDAARLFVSSGGLLIDRNLGDDEIESLYGVSDMIWCCYSPTRDQASGIFGRSMQFGVPTLVRKGALMDRIAASLGAPAVSLEYGNVTQASDILSSGFPSGLLQEERAAHAEMIGAWRRRFLDTSQDAFRAKLATRPSPLSQIRP